MENVIDIDKRFCVDTGGVALFWYVCFECFEDVSIDNMAQTHWIHRL